MLDQNEHSVRLLHVLATLIPNLVLIYQVHLTSGKALRKRFSKTKLSFLKVNLPPEDKVFC